MPKQPKQPIPSFNLVHAGYSSPFLTFHHYDIQDSAGHILQKVSRGDTPLVARFQYLPVLIAGNYYLDRPMVAPEELVQHGRAFSFDQVRSALASHYKGYDQLGQVTLDINTETNILTAILCRATGNRPASVCSAPIVKRLLKHIS